MKYLKRGLVGLLGLLASFGAMAASVIDFEDAAFTGAMTDLTDTVSAASAWVLGFVLAVLVASIGIKLIKRFGNKA